MLVSGAASRHLVAPHVAGRVNTRGLLTKVMCLSQAAEVDGMRRNLAAAFDAAAAEWGVLESDEEEENSDEQDVSELDSERAEEADEEVEGTP